LKKLVSQRKLESQRKLVMLNNMMKSQLKTKPISRRFQTLRTTPKTKIKELLKCKK
jgi:hypothetical protein